MPDTITPIDSPLSLPAGLLRMYRVEDVTEAVQVAAGRRAYLHQSKCQALYLYVEAE